MTPAAKPTEMSRHLREGARPKSTDVALATRLIRNPCATGESIAT